MRIPQQNQLQLDCLTIEQIDLNTNCRHRIVPVLRGLQHLHSQTELLDTALDRVPTWQGGQAESVWSPDAGD